MENDSGPFLVDQPSHRVLHSIDGELCFLARGCPQLSKDSVVLWLRGNRENTEALRKFAFSPVLATQLDACWEEIVDILGDPLSHIVAPYSESLSWDAFNCWWAYHARYHATFEGEVADSQWAYDQWKLEGPAGALAYAMIRDNLPMPIDLYARKYREIHAPPQDHEIFLILESYDTSCYEAFFVGDVEGTRIILELDTDDLVERSLREGSAIPVDALKEHFVEGDLARLKKINEESAEDYRKEREFERLTKEARGSPATTEQNAAIE